MRTIIIFLVSCITVVHAQEWKKYHLYDLGLSYTITYSDWLTGGRHFRINPYDNSLWFARNTDIQTLSIAEGEASAFRWTNTPLFRTSSVWATFEFLSGKVFALDESYGLFQYENGTWTNPYDPPGLSHGMTIDGDTLYILKNNQPIEKWVNGISEPLYDSGTFKRIVAKNSQFWMGYGTGSTSLGFYSETGVFNWNSPSTSLVMDNYNFDYKFSPHHDTLYVAGNKGLSLMHNLTFFDSIAPDNTTNMPVGVILDFEFDADDNIWALFGSDAQTPVSIAHYDQPTKTWDAYYDATNADLNLDTYASIEMDTTGNLWMVNRSYIHVLDLAGIPAWLSAKQPSIQTTVSVYPNPVTEQFRIDTDVRMEELRVIDQLGKNVKTLDAKQQEFSIAELPSGIYLLEMVNEKKEKSVVKLVKE